MSEDHPKTDNFFKKSNCRNWIFSFQNLWSVWFELKTEIFFEFHTPVFYRHHFFDRVFKFTFEIKWDMYRWRHDSQDSAATGRRAEAFVH